MYAKTIYVLSIIYTKTHTSDIYCTIYSKLYIIFIIIQCYDYDNKQFIYGI